MRLAVALTAALCLTVAGCTTHTPAAPTRARRAARVPSRRARPFAVRIRPFSTRLPVYCGGHRPYAALTFDDGPGVYTGLALRILRRAHVRATFFLVGRNLRRWGALAKAETPADALGNHTYTHPLLRALSARAARREIASTMLAIHHVTGVRVRLFRPPYGSRSPAIDAIAHRLGLTEVLWNVDSGDSEGANYAAIARNVERGVRPGAIVLMHENRGQAIRALKFLILPALRHRHLHLVTVPGLLAHDPPSAAQLRAGRRGCPTNRAAGAPRRRPAIAARRPG